MNHTPADQLETAGDELAWLAFRFIAGEMSADESLAFEARLADDQAAREAVAEAVELLHAVCAAEASEPVVAVARHERTRWSQKVTWLASGAVAAAVLVAVGLNLNSPANWSGNSWSGNTWSGNSSEPTVAAVSPALADAWSAVRSEYTGGDDYVAMSRSSVTSDDSHEDELVSFTDEPLTLATETPSWMTAAVLGLSNRDAQPLDSGESPPQEN